MKQQSDTVRSSIYYTGWGTMYVYCSCCLRSLFVCGVCLVCRVSSNLTFYLDFFSSHRRPRAHRIGTISLCPAHTVKIYRSLGSALLSRALTFVKFCLFSSSHTTTMYVIIVVINCDVRSVKGKPLHKLCTVLYCYTAVVLTTDCCINTLRVRYYYYRYSSE